MDEQSLGLGQRLMQNRWATRRLCLKRSRPQTRRLRKNGSLQIAQRWAVGVRAIRWRAGPANARLSPSGIIQALCLSS